MSRRLGTSLLTLALAIGLPAAAFAQSQATTGVIEGTVVDPSGAALPGATVTLQNTATNFERVVVSDGAGRFRAPLLPLGPYRVTVASMASRPWCARGSTCRSARPSPSPCSSQLSAVEQEIVGHRARRRSSRPARTEGATRIDDEAVENLPNNGRNFLDFTKLTPGVSDRPGAGRRRAVDQRPEGDQQQRLGRRRRLQQPLLRRAARRPAPGLHLQPRRRPGGRGGGRRRQRRVRPLARPASSTSSPSRAPTTPSGSGAPLLQERQPVGSPQNPDGSKAPKVDSTQDQVGFTARRTDPCQDKLFFFLAGDVQRGDSTKQTDPNRIEQRRGGLLRRARQPERERPDRAHQRRPGLPGQDRLAGLRPQPARPCATTTPGPSRRTAPSTSTRGDAAPTPTRRTTPTPAPAR